jgi:predicted NAD/FAD-dependent oxidoreductase
MSSSPSSGRVAIVGAGIAGAACAVGLQKAGLQVTLFDKSRGVGGRMATRRASWTDDRGGRGSADFDHGAQHFSARHPRFRAVMARAQTAGCVAAWQPRVHRDRPVSLARRSFVAVPNMPSLCRHLLAGVPLRLGQAVQRLQRAADGWQVVLAGGDTHGPFDQVMLAMPPGQAALLLAGHADAWADTLAAVPMLPCWTLMAVTADVDWPWDAAEPARGPLAWVVRNDRKPGREAVVGCATWVAHATPEWSAEHLDDEPAAVADALGAALAAQLPGSPAPRWLHGSVHRWRYAAPAGPVAGGGACSWTPQLGWGVCGDFLAGGDVESAWRSGDELADTVAAWLEAAADAAAANDADVDTMDATAAA